MFNNSETEIINKMRLDGLGYKAIAKAINSTRDRVRRYCFNHNLDGFGDVVAANVDLMKDRNLICACCNKPIKQKDRGRNRRFCSNECRRKWWNDNPQARKKKETAIYKYTCPHCGKEFSCYGNKKRKYCSHNCYIKSKFWSEDYGEHDFKKDSNY